MDAKNAYFYMNDSLSEQELYDECLSQLQARHGDTKHYLVPLKMYVKSLKKAQALLEEIMDEDAIVQHTNKADHTNAASSPKVRMWALFNEQSMKLGKDLGLNLHQSKAGRPAKKKKGFDTGNKMKVA